MKRAPSSYDVLYRSYNARIDLAVRSRLSGYPDHTREDAIQEIWIDLLQEAHSGQPVDDRRVQTLIERHIKRTKRRANRAWRETPIGPVTAGRSSTKAAVRSDNPTGAVACLTSPEDQLHLRQLGAQLHQLLSATLSATQLNVLHWRVARGHSVHETAQALRVSKDVVKNELSRGLSRLAKCTDEGLEPPSAHQNMCDYLHMVTRELIALPPHRPEAASHRAAA